MNTTKNLPPASHHPSSKEHSDNNVDDGQSLSSINEIEQRMRAAFMFTTDFNDLKPHLNTLIENLREEEENHLFGDVEAEQQKLQNSNHPWLSTRLEKIFNEKKEIYDRRQHWYDDMPDEIEKKTQRANRMLNWERKETDRAIFTPFSELQLTVAELDGSHTHRFRNLDDFIVCKSPSYAKSKSRNATEKQKNDTYYGFYPWYGVTCCTCDYKQQVGPSTLCKHEIAALIKNSNDNFAFDSLDPRFTRMVHSQAYNVVSKQI